LAHPLTVLGVRALAVVPVGKLAAALPLGLSVLRRAALLVVQPAQRLMRALWD
jgi:hypothetical protein